MCIYIYVYIYIYIYIYVFVCVGIYGEKQTDAYNRTKAGKKARRLGDQSLWIFIPDY